MRIALVFVIMATVYTTGLSQSRVRGIHEKNGKIGIGTKTPDELLTVKGKIHTQEVLVDLNGAVAPDYVFEAYLDGTSTLKPEYTLPTLNDIAQYIEENHHLPGVPSAEQMNAEGISLKKMNLLLLEKIEELTIYTIEQQKEIETLKEILSELKE